MLKKGAANSINCKSFDDVFRAELAEIKSARTFALTFAPIMVAVLPFLKGLVAKAFESGGAGWGDLAKRIASRRRPNWQTQKDYSPALSPFVL
jgi:hypothetical protein